MKTDAQLQQDVMAELRWEPAVQAAEIGVEVHNGVVTLAGEVGSYAEKWHAERAAQRVHGVMALAVEIAVRLSPSGLRSDTDIAQAAKNILCWTSGLPEHAIQVMVEGGCLTLSGQVKWQYQRLDATDAVRHLPGVTAVSNQIAIQPAVSAGRVQSEFEAALKRRARLDAKAIGVEVHGSMVTLTGTVHSWAERELANRSAWGTAGVGHVDDQMTLVD